MWNCVSFRLWIYFPKWLVLLSIFPSTYYSFVYIIWGFPNDSVVKNLHAMQETWIWSLGQEDPLEEETATHSSTLGWRIPWTKEPGQLQPIGLQRVGHNWIGKYTPPTTLLNSPVSRFSCRNHQNFYINEYVVYKERQLYLIPSLMLFIFLFVFYCTGLQNRVEWNRW